MNEIILLRMGERILADIIGGICIYLGYSLFLRISEQKTGDAKMSFPGGISVHIARVGPGVFFTLFGATLVSLSFFKPVSVNSDQVIHEATPGLPDSSASVAAGKINFTGMNSPAPLTEQEASADARVKLRKDIQLLNTLPNSLRTDLPPQDRIRIDLALDRIKLTLMKPVWGEAAEGWGTWEEFEIWQKNGSPSPPPARIEKAVEFFSFGQALKP